MVIEIGTTFSRIMRILVIGLVARGQFLYLDLTWQTSLASTAKIG